MSRDVQDSGAVKRYANVCSLHAERCIARIISDPHRDNDDDDDDDDDELA